MSNCRNNSSHLEPMKVNIVTDLELLTEGARQCMMEFGKPPEISAAAPGRVNLIGEHTDYNDGFVLPMAIPLTTFIVGRCNNLNKIRIKSTSHDVQKPSSFEFCIPKIHPFCPVESPKWVNYVAGVVSLFKEAPVPGFDAVISSSVPLGSGLSSSAALEVATYTFLEALTNCLTKSTKEKALICQQAEHRYAGVPCGIMDQFISTMGQPDCALLIDCRSLEAEFIPMNNPDVEVLVTNSNVKHDLAKGEYAIRKKQCEEAAKILGCQSLRDVGLEELEKCYQAGTLNEITYRRARHVISEIQRTKDAAKALATGDVTEFGKFMFESHYSLSKDYEVSCPELDELVEIAASTTGVLGSRMTGGGFGGCTVTMVMKSSMNNLIEQIKQQYKHEATFYTATPSIGSRIIKLEEFHVKSTFSQLLI